MIVSIIVAMAEGSRIIGEGGQMPWRLPADLAYFRERTMGHTLIMGRRTFDSLQGRTLPGRRIIVLTRNSDWAAENPGVLTAGSIQEALRLAEDDHGDSEAFISGGAQIYAQALANDHVDRIYMTIVHAEIEGDTQFPLFDEAAWRLASSESRSADEKNPYAMTFQVFEKRKP